MQKTFYVDHHIQKSILDSLMKEGTSRFSKLKAAEIENSLFMYHMRKLIARGIVAKTADGFNLTAEGARWINKVGLESFKINEPRNLVQFICIQDKHILISERVGHLAEHMNRYLLPGGLHEFGVSSLDSAKFATERFGLRLIPEPIARIEVIHSSISIHSISDIYEVSADSTDYRFKDEFYEMRFYTLDEVLTLGAKEADVLPQIVGDYLDKKIDFRSVYSQ